MISSENVMVTGVGGGGLGEQLLKALRLSSVSYRIIGTDITPLSKGLLEADVFEILPRADHSSYISAVLELCEKHSVKAIFYLMKIFSITNIVNFTGQVVVVSIKNRPFKKDFFFSCVREFT